MSIELGNLPAKIQPVLDFGKRYIKFIFFITMLLIAIFLVFRINQLNTLEPSEDDINDKLQTVQRPRLDPSVVESIEQLQDQNIQVQALFDDARNNPFSE